MINVLVSFAIGSVLGFIGAYAFDTFLQWRDDRKWR